MRLATLAAAAAIALALPAVAQAREACPAKPANVKADTGGGDTRASKIPELIEIAHADALIDKGRYREARKILDRLARTPRDERQIAARAEFRIARMLILQKRFAEAEAAAQRGAAKATDPALKARARKYAGEAAYAAALADSEADLDAAEALYKAGDLDKAEAALGLLLERPCPTAPEYFDKVELRLASVALSRGDAALAHTRLAEVDLKASPGLTESAAALEAKIAQREVDDAARAELDAARAIASQDRVEEALARVDALPHTHPKASPGIQAQGRLTGADLRSRLQRFAEARAIVADVRAASTDEDILARATEVSARIDRRETDALARAELDRARAAADAGQVAEAHAILDGLRTRQPSWPDDWRQTASLQKAGLLRRQGDYRASDALIDEVEAAPAEQGLADRAARERAALEAARPQHAARGAVEVGLGYDSNAPAVTAAIPGEDEANPFPADQEFDDVLGSLLLTGEYRYKLNDRYDHIRVGGALSVVEQADLEPLDRLALSLAAGPVFQAPSWGGALQGGVSFDRVYRGGDALYDQYGLYLGVERQAFTGWNLSALYVGGWRDDDRDEQDGWRNGLRLTLDEASSAGWTVEAVLSRASPDRKDVRYTSFEGAGGYRWEQPRGERWLVGADLGARLALLDYEGPREDTRARAALGVDATFDGLTTYRAEFTSFWLTSNLAGRPDRDNQRVEFLVRRRF